VGPGAPGQVKMSIADTGPGIAPEHLGKIFDPFFSTKEKGTGLGLALVQQILAEHGGRVEVSSPPGGGTVFTLALPALSPEARIPPEVRAGVAEESDEVGGELAPVVAPAAKLH
jgi:signal transduction histidine kinase